MNDDRTWQRLVRIVSLVGVCFLGLAVFNRVTAQQPQGKSKAKSVQHEDVATLLHEASLLLQAGKLDEAEPLVRREAS